jgi:uncharacterized protein YukJ
MNRYCMFKGTVVNAAPFKPNYVGSPHYVVNVKAGDGNLFKIVINSASDTVGEGNNNVYFYADLNFEDPVTDKLGKLESGLHTDDFPRPLDYWQDSSLLDIKRTDPVSGRGGQPRRRQRHHQRCADDRHGQAAAVAAL